MEALASFLCCILGYFYLTHSIFVIVLGLNIALEVKMGFLKDLFKVKVNAKIYKQEAEIAAMRLADIREQKKLSYKEFLMQVETLLQEALRSVGIGEELSNDQCKQIAQLSVRYSENKMMAAAEAHKILKDFI